MPISSGATGRVGVGVDTSIMWTPEGWKQDANPLPRNCDSYLKRYLETHPKARKRSNSNTSEEDTHDHFSKQRSEGKKTFSKDRNRHRGKAREQDESRDGKLSSGTTTKKSSTCTLL
ncbi:hypothetical protein AAFF_G00009690 [Aldrovandia affinis]|uniref:Uncharacterized protein n=1 Tax=Aldrovandia affinis TaxID=143900 RepID=A0AAD7S703_9TELE|nr:hypothetical protein AAFF_G00009690 [Aldrovandia affinis]